MSADAVRAEILEKMRALYQPPRAMPEAIERQALSEYIDALTDFPPSVLAKAWTAVRDSFGGRSWPPVGVFVKAAREAARSDGTLKHESPADREERKRKERWQLWLSNRTSETARQAASEGWAWPFKLAILDDGQVPFGAKLAEMRLFALNRAERIERCCAGLAPKEERKARAGFTHVAMMEAETAEEVDKANARVSQKPRVAEDMGLLV